MLKIRVYASEAWTAAMAFMVMYAVTEELLSAIMCGVMIVANVVMHLMANSVEDE